MMSPLLTRPRALVAISTTAAACSLGLVACGDDKKSSSTPATAAVSTPAANSTAAAAGATDPRTTIAAWFTAARTGDAKAKCALESDVYQQEQYNGIGQACLDDAANGQPQPVWAVKTKIVSLDEQGDFASAVVEPNANTPDQAIVAVAKESGGWRIASFQ